MAHDTITLSERAEKLLGLLHAPVKLGDIRSIAKDIKRDHALALGLWQTQNIAAMLLAILIMDVRELDGATVERLFSDIDSLNADNRIQLADWLLANQLSKNKKTVSMVESWEESASASQRRLFWYHQGRLRWVGQTPPENSVELLDKIEKKLLSEQPEVQWAMNFTAAWIGIFDKTLRARCITIGEKLGLYKDEVVARNCSPNYLPAFIATEVRKRNL